MACECESNSKDQTPKAVGEYLETEFRAGRRGDKEAIGLGTFLIPDPAAGPLLSKVVVVHDLTYRDVILRGLNCRAFKWFPYGMRLEVDGKQIEIDRKLDCSTKECAGGSPCGWGAYCGDARCCFCDGDFFGIKYCSW